MIITKSGINIIFHTTGHESALAEEAKVRNCGRKSTLLVNQYAVNWRRWMGIEPTWDFVEFHAGFEDQTLHQQGTASASIT